MVDIIFLVPIVLLAVDDIMNKFKDLKIDKGMKRTSFITPAMKELLIPSEGTYNLFQDGLARLQKGDKSFFDLQTFPHVGDIVAGLEGDFTLFKVKCIDWAKNNEVRIAPKNEVGYPITKLYPICISNEILIRLGFYWDKRFNKFRLRLKDFRNIDIEKSSFSMIGYIREIGPILYLHELQAVLRIYNIDQGIIDQKLLVDRSLHKVDWVNNKI